MLNVIFVLSKCGKKIQMKWYFFKAVFSSFAEYINRGAIWTNEVIQRPTSGTVKPMLCGWMHQALYCQHKNQKRTAYWNGHIVNEARVVVATQPNIYNWEHTKMNSAVQRIHGPFLSTNRTLSYWMVHLCRVVLVPCFAAKSNRLSENVGIWEEFWWILRIGWRRQLPLQRDTDGLCLTLQI